MFPVHDAVPVSYTHLQGTATATEGGGRRDGKEEEVIFNRGGLATDVAGPFLLQKVVDEL